MQIPALKIPPNTFAMKPSHQSLCASRTAYIIPDFRKKCKGKFADIEKEAHDFHYLDKNRKQVYHMKEYIERSTKPYEPKAGDERIRQGMYHNGIVRTDEKSNRFRAFVLPS